MKLAFLCNEYPPGPHGGIGTFVQVMARGLVERGHPVRVVGIYAADYPAPDFENDRGVDVWRLRRSSIPLGWIWDRYRLFRRMAAWIHRQEVDLVEMPDYGALGAGWPRLRAPLVARLHGSVSYFAAEMGLVAGREFLLERQSLRRADFWCSVSRYLADRTRTVFSLSSEPDAILFNPVTIPTQLSNERRQRSRVVFAGTLTKKKGVIQLIQNWPRIRRCVPDAELHFFGKDGETDRGGSMQELLLALLPADTRKSVHFHGHVRVTDLQKEFERASVAVFPSCAEGFALTPMEAMASGCPTVYTSRGSGPDLIEHGRDGLLVDPDRPDEIADAIVSILLDSQRAVSLGLAGRRRVEEKFATKKLLPLNEEFYANCIRRFSERNLRGNFPLRLIRRLRSRGF